MNSIPIWHSGLSVLNPRTDQPLLVPLRDIVTVTREHYVLEEALLLSCGVPALEDVKFAHASAYVMLNAMVADALQDCTDRIALATKVTGWIVHHLYEIDMPVKGYLRGRSDSTGDRLALGADYGNATDIGSPILRANEPSL